MFQSLRANQQFYILTKGQNPRLDVGIVTTVTAPQMKFQAIPQGLGSQPEYVVDVTVTVSGAPQQYRRQKLQCSHPLLQKVKGRIHVTLTLTSFKILYNEYPYSPYPGNRKEHSTLLPSRVGPPEVCTHHLFNLKIFI